MEQKQTRVESRNLAKWKIKNFLRNSHNIALSAFWAKDADKSGLIQRHEFEEVLDGFKLGLTIIQKSEILRQYSEADTVDYKLFISDHTKPGFNPIKAAKKGLKEVVLEEPPKRKPSKKQRAMASRDKRAPLLVFLAGWLFCPVWCVAWVWINSKYPRTKSFARASVLLSMIFTLGIIVLAVLLYILADVDVPTGLHCPDIEGVVVAFRMAGDKANKAAFWNRDTGDIENQYRLKRAFFVVYNSQSLERTLQVEQAVLIDRLEDLEMDPTSDDRATLYGIVRIRTVGPMETEWILRQVPSWFQDGSLIKAFLDEGIPVRALFLDRVQYFEDSPDYTDTPVAFKQTLESRVGAIDSNWIISRPLPYLMRQPPMTGNALDYDGPGFTFHRFSYMQTCWMVVLFTLPSDPCLRNSSLTCAETGGDARELQVRVFTNSTKQLYEVYIREHEGALPFGTPQPTYLVDEEAALRTRLDPNLFDCESGYAWTCSLMHRFNVAKGPFLSHFWIGIVGLTPESQFAPFEVHTRMLVGTGNPPRGQQA